VQLLPAVVDAQPVGSVDNPDQGIRLLKVVAPVGAESFLAADVPWMCGQCGKLEIEKNALTDVEFVPGGRSACLTRKVMAFQGHTLRSRWS
jgi:ribosomal protein S27AE